MIAATVRPHGVPASWHESACTPCSDARTLLVAIADEIELMEEGQPPTAEKAAPADADPARGKLPPQNCARAGRASTFYPRHPAARYCSGNCRAAAYKARKALGA